MNLKNFIAAASIAILPVAAANAASIIVPAVGTGAGASGSRWQSELTIHNAGSTAVAATLVYHEDRTASAPVALTIAPRTTLSIADIVKTKFGRESGRGALVIETSDAASRRLAVSSRTFNLSAGGEFGQDIPSTRATDAAGMGDISVLAAPSSTINYRFNFGIYAAEATTVKWELYRADGTAAGSKEVTYTAGQHAQYDSGTAALFNTQPANSDTIHATIVSGKAVFYGSAINLQTGDPTFVPPVEARDAVRIQFAGLDVDENGTVDIADADQDGELDAELELVTSMFPAFMRLVASSETNEDVTFTIVSSPASAVIVGGRTLQVAPTGELKGTTGEIRLRASVGSDSTILTIPVRFR